MAHLYKPTYTQPIPASATRHTVEGVEHVRWTTRNKIKRSAPVSTKDPARCVVESEVWWISYTDHEGRRRLKKAFKDRRASERLMLEITTRIDRVVQGDITPASQNRGNRTVTELIDEWAEDLRAKDLSAEHVKTSRHRVHIVREGVEATRIPDLTRLRVTGFLRELRERPVRPISVQTSNHYLTAVRAFCRWCVLAGYVDQNPLAEVELLDVRGKQTFERRSLTPFEVTCLLAATATNKLHQCPLSGEDRVALYLVAIVTGLRVEELASLTKSSFRLNSSTPQIRIHGRSAKNSRTELQPVPELIAAELSLWLRSRPATGPVWPGYNWVHGHAADMLRRDLVAAKIPIETDEGRVDFHALRGVFATLLANAGVPIQHAQALMRHSDPGLTMKHYTHLKPEDLALQVSKIPSV